MDTWRISRKRDSKTPQKSKGSSSTVDVIVFHIVAVPDVSSDMAIQNPHARARLWVVKALRRMLPSVKLSAIKVNTAGCSWSVANEGKSRRIRWETVDAAKAMAAGEASCI